MATFLTEINTDKEVSDIAEGIFSKLDMNEEMVLSDKDVPARKLEKVKDNIKRRKDIQFDRKLSILSQINEVYTPNSGIIPVRLKIN